MTGGTSNAGGALGAIFRDFTAGLANHTEATAPGVLKALAAVLYAGTSLFIVFANKLLFATWGFPSYPFLALAQYVTTAMVLYLRKRSQVRAHNAAVATAIASGGGGGGGGGAGLAGSVGGGAGARGGAGRRTNVARGLRTPAPHTIGSAASFTIPQQPQWLYPDVTWGSLRAVMPLPLLFFANTVTGLGATKNLNVPMFVLLRRFSIIMTMGFEMYLLARRPSRTVQISVVLMVVSAAIAAYGDLEMNATGYWLILLNDVFTALQGVVLRSKLDEGQKRRDAQPKRTSPNENNSTTGGAAQGGDGASLTLTTRQAILNAAAGHGQPIVISGPSMPLPPSSPNTGNTDTTAVNVAPSDSSSGASTPRANNVVNLASARGPKPTESPSATQWTPPAGQQQQQQQQNPALVRQHALSADSLMFYNALCSIPLALGLFLSRPEEVHAMMAFHEWDKPAFLVCFASSMFLGFAMNYSYFLCTKVNSPLTTTVIGSLKNIVSTYLGMLIDFKPHFINFIGINLSVVATLVYSYDEVKRVRDRYAAASQQQQPQPPASTTTAV